MRRHRFATKTTRGSAIAQSLLQLPVSRSPSDTVVNLLSQNAVVASVLALGAGLGEGSWAILGVAVGLILCEVWAVFWGPRAWVSLSLHVAIQLALLGTFIYAVATHNQHHSFFDPKH